MREIERNDEILSSFFMIKTDKCTGGLTKFERSDNKDMNRGFSRDCIQHLFNIKKVIYVQCAVF